MIIKSLKLNNFRQFKGVHNIDFSTDKQKNVTIFIGNITSGKTTILNAFRWCLYGEHNFDTKEVLNLETLYELSPYDSVNVEVEIVLLHEGREYTITRSQKYSRSNNLAKANGSSVLKIIYKDSTGATMDDSYDYNQVIESILPKDLSEYFFVEGEKVKNINKKQNLKESVKNIMGINVIQTGRDHLDEGKPNSVISKFQKEFDTGNDKRTQDLSKIIDDSKAEMAKLEEEKFTIENEIEYFEDEKNRLNNLLLENKDVEQMQRETNDLEREINSRKSSVEVLENRFNGVFRQDTYKFFAAPLINKALKIIDDANELGEGIPEMRAPAIDYILNRGYCICGCDLTRNEGARDHLINERNLLPPEHIGITLSNFKKKCNECLNFNDFAKRTNDDFKLWRTDLRDISIKQEKIDAISKQMVGRRNVEEVRNQYDEACRNLSRQNQLKGINGNNYERAVKKLNDAQAELDSMVVRSEKNEKINKYVAYAREIYKWFDESYKKHEREVKGELLESVNKIFTKMYVSGQRKVEMDDDYRISLKYNDGRPDTSTGLETIKNFSFIGGLIDLARAKAKSKLENSDVEISTEPYPLVMDAPFSPLDPAHIESASKLLPELAEQLIIFVKENDWNSAKNILEEKVGSKYEIVKLSEIHSEVRGI